MQTKKTIPVPARFLAKLSPMSTFAPEDLKRLAAKAFIESKDNGHVLFKKGEKATHYVYLVKGAVHLCNEKGKPLKKIVAGSSDARLPLAHFSPRDMGAKSDGASHILFVPARAVDDLNQVNITKTGGFQVLDLGENNVEQGGDEDWMTHILQSEAFKRIPPSNIQAIFMRMEPIPVKAGHTVIKQGEEGDYFYVIGKGRCIVTRVLPQSKTIKLAELSTGDSFGEEALVADAKRNATVTMVTDGTLIRLAKDDFSTLLKDPLLKRVAYSEGVKRTASEQLVWLDVRLPPEYESSHIKGALNLPFIFIKMKLKAFDKKRQYIVYCDNEKRSAAACFLLNQNGVDASLLKGGFASVPASDRVSGKSPQT